MLLLRAVHVSSTFEFGAVFNDCLALFRCHLEFGAVFHDCLSADPQGNPPFSPFFGAP